MQKTNEHGFGIIEIIMAIAIVGLLGVVAYQAFQLTQKKDDTAAESTKTTASTSPSTTSKESDAALANVKAFYKKYLGIIFTADESTFSGNEYAVSDWVKDGYVTQAAADQENGNTVIDMATCSQSPLTYKEYGFSTPVLSGTTGTMNLTGTYKGLSASNTSDDQPVLIKLTLAKDKSTWKIDSFTCHLSTD